MEYTLTNSSLSSSSNEDENSQYPPKICSTIHHNLVSYVLPTLHVVGLAFNVINVVVYRLLLRMAEARDNKQMNKFLLFESIFESYFCLCILGYFSMTFNIKSKHLALIHYIFFYYGSYVVMQMSVLCKIAACIIRLRKVTSCSAVTSRLLRPFANFKTILALMFLFSTAVYSIHLVDIGTNKVPAAAATSDDQVTDNTTKTTTSEIIYIYWITDKALDRDNRLLLLAFLSSIARNFLIIVCILVLNIFTLINTKKFLNKKRKLTIEIITMTKKPTSAGGYSFKLMEIEL